MEKQCSKCNEWKELNNFYKRKNSKDGYNNQCKECIKQKYQKWCKNNPKKRKEIHKKWYKNNSEKVKEIHKKWCVNNPEYKKEYNKSNVLWDSVFPEQIKQYEEIRQNDIYLEVKCAYCGKWFKPTNLEIRSRLQAINGTTEGDHRIYCSNNCKKECPTYRQRIYPKGFKKATSREVQPELRQLVLLRDNYTCQKCEKHQNELEVGLHCHHITGIKINPIESADIDNCITLCKKCHKEVHRLPGCNYFDMRCKTN